MDDKKGNKWFAVLMGALALSFIVLIVVVVIGMSSVKKQYNDAKKVSEEAAAELYEEVQKVFPEYTLQIVPDLDITDV